MRRLTVPVCQMLILVVDERDTTVPALKSNHWTSTSCREGRTSCLRRILLDEPIHNISASASARPDLMPQSHFLSVPPRDWDVVITIRKGAGGAI